VLPGGPGRRSPPPIVGSLLLCSWMLVPTEHSPDTLLAQRAKCQPVPKFDQLLPKFRIGCQVSDPSSREHGSSQVPFVSGRITAPDPRRGRVLERRTGRALRWTG
jgi:hypothetical protein